MTGVPEVSTQSWNLPDGGKQYIHDLNSNNVEEEPFIKNWLDREYLHLIQTLTEADQEMYKTFDRLYSILTEIFRPLYNET